MAVSSERGITILLFAAAGILLGCSMLSVGSRTAPEKAGQKAAPSMRGDGDSSPKDWTYVRCGPDFLYPAYSGEELKCPQDVEARVELHSKIRSMQTVPGGKSFDGDVFGLDEGEEP